MYDNQIDTLHLLKHFSGTASGTAQVAPYESIAHARMRRGNRGA